MAEKSATKQYLLAAEFSAAGYTLLLPGGVTKCSPLKVGKSPGYSAVQQAYR
nr:MAG TPA: hypothetical protein [Caudoviricetes sp.]